MFMGISLRLVHKTEIFLVSFSLFNQIPGQGHNFGTAFRPHIFQSNIHAFYNPKLYGVSYLQRR